METLINNDADTLTKSFAMFNSFNYYRSVISILIKDNQLDNIPSSRKLIVDELSKYMGHPWFIKCDLEINPVGVIEKGYINAVVLRHRGLTIDYKLYTFESITGNDHASDGGVLNIGKNTEISELVANICM